MTDMREPITIKMGGMSRTVLPPESWNSLSKREVLLFYNTLFPDDSYNTTLDFTPMKLIGMTQWILGLSLEELNKWEATRIQEDAEFGAINFVDELKQVITHTLSGLFEVKESEEGATSYTLRTNLTNNPWPTLIYSGAPKSKGRAPSATVLHAAGNAFANMTIYEMAMVLSAFEAYSATQDEAHVNEIIGIIYRPSRPVTKRERDSDWSGDRRMPLRRYEGKVAERAQWAKGIDKRIKRVIMFWVASCRDKIAQDWPSVFKASGKGSGASSANPWADLLLSISEKQVFGPLDKTADQNYANVFQYLDLKHREAIEMEREMKKRKKK